MGKRSRKKQEIRAQGQQKIELKFNDGITDYIAAIIILAFIFLIVWCFYDDTPAPRYVSYHNYHYYYNTTIYFKAKIKNTHKINHSDEYGKSKYRYEITWHGWDPEYKRYDDITCTTITSKEKAYQKGDILAFLEHNERDARDCRIPTKNPESVYLYLKWYLSKLFR
ncbi:hypothetical protein AAGU66_11030 [Edwardsiella ictaluri]|uniref:DUF3592 domain-containing protein n=1 Tax=Edwardsiella ictaluri TaxID=67780 RepID=A0ABY8GH75_EDWIC|nr:hypothetical protein [Edwardsiella ictaluri]EKS7761816.1 hypothetical protein [Edwardsiella ictaluri]EKS7768626.1 hypothetical protein [Edwardsiella ictaluri]EKS7772056.1 hypothetical protein [Edwardsiella ictaluri]EKS7775443.1 hypothetical protein [Edwardsiella ictaluri]EKS7785355.1 hypothetical protein [Edwardsiella ictaluri]